jgi:hypothetical protein
LSAIVLFPGEGKWLFHCGWGKISTKPLQGKSFAPRVHIATDAPVVSLVGKLSERKFHLPEDQLKGGAAAYDPNNLHWKLQTAS